MKHYERVADPYGLISEAERIAARRWNYYDVLERLFCKDTTPITPVEVYDTFEVGTCPVCNERVYRSQLTTHPCWWD